VHWPNVAQVAEGIELPLGACIRAIRTREVPVLITLIHAWYPRVHVGSESVFLDEAFFRSHVCLDDALDKDIWACVLEVDGLVRGLVSFERDVPTRILHARIGVLDPALRLGFVGTLGILAYERLGKLCGAEMLLQRVTLSSKHQQVIAERRGFRLVGVVPGYDRTQVAEGLVLRTTEAIYAKLLVDAAYLDPLDTSALTANTKRIVAALQLRVEPD
jgi:hypothetical protein